MAVDFQALRDLDPTELQGYVDAWTTVATRMSDSASLYSSDVHEGMGSDDWSGAAAEHAGTRSGELHALLEAGNTEAAAIRDILTSAVERFGTAKSALDDVVAQVDQIAELRITDSGKVEINPDADVALEVLWSVHIGIYQEQVDSAIDDAQTADDEIAGALSLAAETDNGGDISFNGQALDLAGLERVREDADRVIELLGGDRYPSQDELRDINELLEENADNPVFAERLMSELGPADLSTHCRNLMTDTEGDDGTLDADVLANLGETLATATNTDNQPSVDTEWVEGFMAEGAETGYINYGPLFEHGDYHEDFSVPVAEHMLRLEPMRDEVGLPYPEPGYNSPLTSALMAVNQNPDAALSLMTGSQDYEHMPYEYGGEQLEPRDDNLTAMLDLAADENYSELLDANVAGNVVEAASTGMPADAPDQLPRVVHTEAMAGVTERLIEYVGTHPGDIESPGAPLNPIQDNLGSITHDYIEDFNRAFTDNTAGTAWQPNSHGHPLDLGSFVADGMSLEGASEQENQQNEEKRENLAQYLQVIGHHGPSSALLWESSLGVTANNMQGALLEPDDLRLNAMEDATEGHGRMMAEITTGRLEAERDDAFAEVDDHNRNVGIFESAVDYTGSEALGTVPVLGGPLGDGWSHAVGGVFGHLEQDRMEAAIAAQEDRAERLGERYDASIRPMIEEVMRNGGMESQIDGVVENARTQYYQPIDRILCDDGGLPNSDGEC